MLVSIPPGQGYGLQYKNKPPSVPDDAPILLPHTTPGTLAPGGGPPPSLVPGGGSHLSIGHLQHLDSSRNRSVSSCFISLHFTRFRWRFRCPSRYLKAVGHSYFKIYFR